MRLTIEPTEHFVTVAGGVTVRVWKGVDDHRGTPVICLVRGVSPQSHDPDSTEPYAQELKEIDNPVTEGELPDYSKESP